MMHNLELIIAQQKQVISKLNARKSEQSCLWLRNIDNWLRYNQTIYFYFKISSIPLRNNENLNMFNILPKILSHSRRVCPKSCFDKPIQNQKTNYLGNSNIKMTPLLGRQVGRQARINKQTSCFKDNFYQGHTATEKDQFSEEENMLQLPR